MTQMIKAAQVGAQDPELKNSPVFEETDEEYEVAGQEMGDAPVCYFNNEAFSEKQYVCSGDDLLRCIRGVWLRVGTCDPENQ